MDEQKIWTFLLSKLNNQFGASAVMGNFFIESRLNPMLLEGSYAKKMHTTSEQYTMDVDSGVYSTDEFAHDKAGYGLAQWTYWSRKLALATYAHNTNRSVGDLNAQLEFFWDELASYKTALSSLMNATSVREASDVFALRYEKPADTSEKALQRRSDKAQEYYDKYAAPAPSPTQRFVRVTADRVNIRTGASKSDKSICRVGKGTTFQYFATDENGWNGVVLWVHPDFSEVIEL